MRIEGRMVLVAGMAALLLGAAPAQAHHNDWAAPLVGGALGGYALGTLVSNSRERTEKRLRIVAGTGLLHARAGGGTGIHAGPEQQARSRPSSTSSISWRPPATSPPPSTRRAATRS